MLYGCNDIEIDNLAKTKKIVSEEIKTRFSVFEYAVLTRIRGKVVECEGTEEKEVPLMSMMKDISTCDN